ncbi:hypothetical protein MMC08_008476, partial [Hypocenomyce scalaris]|nr:hypothetical protein [Hypocenomyce scalaris]
MAIASPLSTKKRKTRKSETPKVLSTVTDTIGELMVEGVEEWADSSTVCEEEMNIKRLRTSNTKENNSTKKAQKAEKKIVKNQMRVQIITSEDIERISQALHPFRIPLGGESCGDQNSNGNGQGLLNNSTIDANITFNTRTF